MSPSASVIVTRVLSFPTAVKQQNPLKRKRYDDEITQERTVFMAMHKEENDTEPPPPPPSWEVLCLLGSYMDPQTLDVASCVSTAWLNCFSSENLWRSKQTAYEPFNFVVALETTEKKISYKRLISTRESDAKRRRKNKHAEPKISLSDLVFTIYVSSGSKEATVVKKGKDLVFGSNERFHILANVSDYGFVAGMRDVRMVWQVMYKKTTRVCSRLRILLDHQWKLTLDGSPKELPASGSRWWIQALVDLFVDDVLRYLQCFLVDC